MKANVLCVLCVASLTACAKASPPVAPQTDAERAQADVRLWEQQQRQNAYPLPQTSPSPEPPAPAPVDTTAQQVAEAERARAAAMNAEAERVKADCASDRPQREKVRAVAEEQRQKDEQKRTKERERAEYLKKHCKRRDRAITAPTDEICENDDGTLRRCTGVYGVEVTYECPPNGPPDARGIVKGGSSVQGAPPGRVAMGVISLGPKKPTRDEICAEADREAKAP
jgi:hypothetical protein